MQRKHTRPLCSQRKGVLCLCELGLSHSAIGWEQLKGRVTLAQTQCRIQSTGRGAWSILLSGVGGCGAHAPGYHSDCAAATALDENCPHQRKLAQPSVDFSGCWDETGCPSLSINTPGTVKMTTPILPRTRSPPFSRLSACVLLIPGR